MQNNIIRVLVVTALLLSASYTFTRPQTTIDKKDVVYALETPEKIKQLNRSPEEVKDRTTALKPKQKAKKTTWRDNPRKCNTKTQWIAKDKPFNCIDKPQVAPKPQPTTQVKRGGGSCADWIASAGIGDVGNAQELIRRESGCNPNAVNPSSGACGVAQELPCGKSGCSLGDGACQVKWMNGYVLGRYGSWASAVAFHNANNWY